MTQAAERTFHIKTCKTSSKKSKSKVFSNITPWFDEECHIARHKATTDGRLASLVPDRAIQSCKFCRSVKQRKKRQFKKTFYQKLYDCNTCNKTNMWNILKPYRKHNVASFDIEDFYIAFKKTVKCRR